MSILTVKHQRCLSLNLGKKENFVFLTFLTLKIKLNITPLPQEYITIRAVFLYRHDIQREYKDEYRDKYSHNSRSSTVNQRQSVNNARQTRTVRGFH